LHKITIQNVPQCKFGLKKGTTSFSTMTVACKLEKVKSHTGKFLGIIIQFKFQCQLSFTPSSS